jgi:alanyl-tRNA synthetase
MTDRLYYNDAHSRTFEARVTRVEPRDGRQAVWLDRTAFYPTSGGQPFDTGTLNNGRVVDVVDEDGEVVHLVEGAMFGPGDDVRGEIDWARRWDHMQQHTGQHVLSAAFIHTSGRKTVSVHFGSVSSTLDLDRDVTQAELTAAEDAANRVVWESRPITIRYAGEDDAAGLALRKPSARRGSLRLVEIEHWDLSACGGTHVVNTGAIGAIVISGSERFKGGVRVEFRCGGRAVNAYRLLRQTVADAGRILSAGPEDLLAAVERLKGEHRELQRTVAALRGDVARHQIAEFVREPEPLPGGGLVARAVDAPADVLRSLAAGIIANNGLAAVIASVETPVTVVVGRSLALALSAQTIVNALTTRFGGRGGGKPDLAQAGGLQASPDEVLDHARQAIRLALG